jgi:hypothetical protein
MKRACSKKRWVETVERVVAEAGFPSAKPVLAGSREPNVVRLRWRAMKILKRQGRSVCAIARASGFHYSTVIYGCSRRRRRRARYTNARYLNARRKRAFCNQHEVVQLRTPRRPGDRSIGCAA